MENNDDLIQALVEEGMAPTEEAIEKLDADITEIAEILLDHVRAKQRRQSNQGVLPKIEYDNLDKAK